LAEAIQTANIVTGTINRPGREAAAGADKKEKRLLEERDP
jgi:hypothetical protein